MNNRWSNVKLKGQMMMKFYELDIHINLMKQGIQWNQNQTIWNYDQGEILVSKSAKICTQIWTKRWTIWFLKWNYLFKSNLNYINCKGYNLITLLTLLTWRLGFKSRRLKCICSISSSACIRRSRGDSDRFLQWFVINLASIWSQLSLECRGITKNLRFFSKIA